MCKKIIKHLTCRRHISSTGSHHTAGARSWTQTFKKGWVQQTFERLCVRESLLHSAENTRYLQREDHLVLTRGKASQSRARPPAEDPPPTIRQRMEAPTVPTELMERAYQA